MTLKQLEAFYWAAHCANFALAAQRLHISLSSLSKRLTELEESLGQPLFDRSGHRAVINPAGERLLPHAEQMLSMAMAVRASVGEGSGVTGRCAFGVGELSALTWLPAFVSLARQEFPDLRLEPHIGIRADLEERMGRGELDFAVIAGRSTRADLLSQPLTEASFTWVATAAVAGAARSMTPALLQRMPLVTLPHGAGTTRILDDWLRVEGVIAEERIVCNHWGAIAGLLLAGVGVGFLPARLAEALAGRNVLQQLSSRVPLASLPYFYQWRRHDARPVIPAMRALVTRSADFSVGSRLFAA